MVKENELEAERQQHIHSSHQGYRSCLLNLQRLCKEGLADDTQNGDQHNHPAVVATEWDFPFTQDGYSDEALDETDDSVVPHGEVVVDTLAQLAKNNKCTSSSNRPYKGSYSPLDVVRVVALNAIKVLAKDEWRPGNEDDSSEGKNGENTVPDCTFLLQKDPSQEGGKNWITERDNSGIC